MKDTRYSVTESNALLMSIGSHGAAICSDVKSPKVADYFNSTEFPRQIHDLTPKINIFTTNLQTATCE